MRTLSYQNKKDDVKYSFAVGKIRAMETRLLDALLFKRLIDSKDTREMSRLLVETSYGDLFKEGSASADFEALLNAELKRTYQLIKDIDPDPASACNLLALHYDFHNLKVLLKLRQSPSEADSFLIPLGLYGPEIIRQMVKSGNYSPLPLNLAEAISFLVSELEKSSPPSQWIDIQLDHILYTYLIHEAEHLNNKFLITLLRLQIDLTNIRTLLRVKQMEKESSFLKSVLLEGGEISKEKMLSFLEEPNDKLIASFNFAPYAQVIKEGITSYEKEKSLALFERLMDNFFIYYIGQSKYIAFGVEPLICYILAKENEIKNLRIVFVGKQNKLPKNIVEERLREIYA